MTKSNIVKKKYEIKRWQRDWLWLLYYWNTIHFLSNNYQSFCWFVQLKNSKSHKHATITKPKPHFDSFIIPNRNSPLQKMQSKEVSGGFCLNIFSNFIVLSLAPHSRYMVPHAQFKLLFTGVNSDGACTLNLKRCFMRWQLTHKLLYNFIYYENSFIVFGHKIFKLDIIALNTGTINIGSTHFKYAHVFHQFRDSLYGSNIDRVLECLETFNMEVAVLSDMANNAKIANNLQTANIYTLGLISFADNPWLVTYPIPVHANGLFTQYYFIRYLHHIQQAASGSKFNELLALWSKL